MRYVGDGGDVVDEAATGEGQAIEVVDLAYALAAKVETNRALGYRFAMLYVTPDRKLAAIRDGTLTALAVDGVRVLPSLGSDEVRKARGDPDHEFFMAVWGDVFGLEAARARRASSAAVAKAPKKPTAKAPRKPTAKAARRASHASSGPRAQGQGRAEARSNDTCVLDGTALRCVPPTRRSGRSLDGDD